MVQQQEGNKKSDAPKMAFMAASCQLPELQVVNSIGTTATAAAGVHLLLAVTVTVTVTEKRTSNEK